MTARTARNSTLRVGRVRAQFTGGVFSHLRKAIVEGEVKPGDRLVEMQVARRFDVSRAAAREVLKRLEGEGLLEAIPRRGYVVPPITIHQVQQLFDLRLILEREAAARAASKAAVDDIEKIARLVGDPYMPGDRDSYRRFLTQNIAFHTAIARLSGNERLTAIVESLLEELGQLFHLGLDIRDRAEELVREHKELVGAIRARDPETAARVVVMQVENSRRMVLEAILGGDLQATSGSGRMQWRARSRST
jgi:DNA-binding GntR family transcriptional regulator